MVRDVNFYRFLQGAIDKKWRDADAIDFQGIDFDPHIYKWAREAFRELKAPEFLNIEKRPVLENLYVKIQTDPRLKPLKDPDSALTEKEYELSEDFHQRYEAERKLAEETRIASSESSTATPSSQEHPISHTPSSDTPSIPTPRTSGAEAATTMTSSQERLPLSQTSSTAQRPTIETGLDHEGKPYIQASTGFQAPKIPSEVTSAAKDASSWSQRTFNRFFGKYLTFNTIAASFTTLIGASIGRAITGTAFGTVAGGVLGAFTPSIIKANLLNWTRGLTNKAIQFGAGVTTQATVGRSFFSFPKRGVLLGGIGLGGGLLFITLVSTVLNPLFNTSSSEATPLTPPLASPTTIVPGLDYTLPLKDPSTAPLDLKTEVKQIFPGAKLEYWDDPIIKRSKEAGWNPALVLALWIEETGASQATLSKNGGSEIITNGALSKGHLGCAPEEDQTIDESLNCLFNFGKTYTNNQFPQFMEKYSSGPVGNPFGNNPFFPSTIKSWYSRLVPQGAAGALTLTPTSQAAGEALGCPTVGTITNPYGYNIPGQPSDLDYYGCEGLASCHSGIDIAYGAGTSIHSIFDGVATAVDSDSIKGKYITISNSQTGYLATFEHLNSQIISQGANVKKGEAIGTMGASGAAKGVHLHFRLEKNGKVINPFRYLGPSALIATISLTQSDDIKDNNYQGKPEVFDWGRCNQVP